MANAAGDQDVERLAHVPQVFVRGVLIGGSEETVAALENGELKRRLAT
jgi:glutaredoxin-related protein